MKNENQIPLVIMAAGIGSRFGGLKQIAPIGPNGEIIVDYSVLDAVKSGFSKVVFIIKKDIEKDFREAIGRRIEKIADVEYAFQEIDKVPLGLRVPDGRTKPWGTAHAVWCAKDAVSTSFAVINADDFYGRGAFKTIYDYLTGTGGTCMVGYRLGNTLTEHGTVSRGVCDIADGMLVGVTEHTALDKNSGIPLDTIVSMNMWGFEHGIFDEIENQFSDFYNGMKNPQKDEFYLPSVVDSMIKNKAVKVRVLDTDEKWYGITYKEDVIPVRAAIDGLIRKGIYFTNLR